MDAGMAMDVMVRALVPPSKKVKHVLPFVPYHLRSCSKRRANGGYRPLWIPPVRRTFSSPEPPLTTGAAFGNRKEWHPLTQRFGYI